MVCHPRWLIFGKVTTYFMGRAGRPVCIQIHSSKDRLITYSATHQENGSSCVFLVIHFYLLWLLLVQSMSVNRNATHEIIIILQHVAVDSLNEVLVCWFVCARPPRYFKLNTYIIHEHLEPLVLILKPAWISNHMPSKVWDEFSNPFQTSTVVPSKFGMFSNFIPLIMIDVITYPCWN